MRPTRFAAPRLATVAAVAALLAACVVVVVALLPLVTPVGGAWNIDQDPATPQIDPAPGECFSVVPTETTPCLLSSPITVRGIYAALDVARQCDGLDSAEVEGTIDDGDLVLHLGNGSRDQVCLRGRFTDLATFRADDGCVYRNRRVDVRFDIGVWVDTADARQRSRFTAPASVNNVTTSSPADEDGAIVDMVGCERAASGARPAISGQLVGYVQVTGAPPSIAVLARDGKPLFTGGVVTDGATIEFGGPGGKVTLRREADDGDPACP